MHQDIHLLQGLFRRREALLLQKLHLQEEVLLQEMLPDHHLQKDHLHLKVQEKGDNCRSHTEACLLISKEEINVKNRKSLKVCSEIRSFGIIFA